MLKCERIVKTFYDALEEGKILARRCSECGHIEYPPYLACNACGNLDTEWVELPEKVMCNQVLPVSAMFMDPDFKANVGDYAIAAIQPENAFEVGSVLLHVSPEEVDEIRAKLPAPVKPVIVQEDGYKNVHWELA
ncbi:MAG: hypothetical protein IKG00_06320 [Lachnospiraceae bacterium]|nr:hypothetical protein [Lachnospiraceae bacterium]MBR3309492.1 hypothetical protein [Lachnospiraceae bacterium]